MAVRVSLHHETHYRYDRPVALGPQTLRLRPAPHCRTPVLRYGLRIDPGPHALHWQQDPQANFVARVLVKGKLRRFDVRVRLLVELAPWNPFDFFLEDGAQRWPFRYEAGLAEDLGPCLHTEPMGPRLSAWLAELPHEEQPTVELLVGLNRRLAREITYARRTEHGVLSAEQTLGQGLGSCRDSAWLLVQILRQLGIAARFVSGYLIQLTSEGGPQTDSADLHAWAEAFVPGAGWVGLDPTSGLLAGEGHLPLACATRPAAAAPIDGSLEACAADFRHEITVARRGGARPGSGR